MRAAAVKICVGSRDAEQLCSVKFRDVAWAVRPATDPAAVPAAQDAPLGSLPVLRSKYCGCTAKVLEKVVVLIIIITNVQLL